MANVLIVDDEPGVLFLLREVLEERGHHVSAFEDARRALAVLRARPEPSFDLILSDYSMPALDGLGFLSEVRKEDAKLPFVLLTARGSERLAVRAMQSGVFDYLPKPFDVEEFEAVVERAIEVSLLRREADLGAAQSTLARPLVGKAPAFRKVVERALRIASRDVPVLVRGETGTGKELLANLLHAGSPRAKAPLVRFNCASIVEDLAERELFGHERGAFTGAHNSEPGYFARAHGGTLVLDEVGELSLRLQPKLLRALESGEIQPVGGKVRQVDVRVVACTHKDLAKEARSGQFREDLYYRLAVVELEMPPLRERREDIPPLAEVFARSAARRCGFEGVTLADDLREALRQRDYPGNVRELQNLVTRLVALSDGGTLGKADLDAPEKPDASRGSFREQVEALERRLLVEALRAASGNQSEAARRLELSRATFLDKLKRYGIVSE